MTTAQELQLLRTYPQHVDMRMSIFRPTTAFACRVNDPSIVKTAVLITYDTVSIGAYTDIEYGMTMHVGTAPGLSDVGTIRVRSANATQIRVAMNSDIEWADNLYLTVLNFYDVVPVFPKIVVDKAHPDHPIFYKDEDIVYTNQNTIMGTLICMGSHREVELRNGLGQIYYSSTGTYNVNGDAVTFFWEFEGGTPGFYSGSTPGFVDYTVPGNYITKLTATSAVGAVDYSYRYIIVNETDGGVKDWEMLSLQGSRDTGGYTASVSIHSPLGYIITPGTPIILSTRQWYGGTQQNIGNKNVNDETWFVGYVLQNTIKYDYQSSSVEFQIGSITELMKLADGFAISIEDVTTPTKWYEIHQLNLKKAAYHFWKWHSTVLLTTDVQYLGTDFLQEFFDSNKESLYDAVAGVLKSARYGELVSDRVGKLWMEISTKATPDAITAFPPVFPIDGDDWIGEPTIEENPHGSISYLEINGIAYSGPGDGNSVPLIACAPGDTPTSRGKFSPGSGLALYNQAQLNALVGDIFWNENARYPNINMDMRGVFGIFDIAPQQAYTITISG